MADNGKLVFPVAFDIAAGVKEAEKDTEGFLNRMDSILKNRPLRLNAEVQGFDELSASLKSLNENLVRLNTLMSTMGHVTVVAQEQATQSIQEHGRVTADTTNTIQRQLMVQERVNKTLRDTYTEQEHVAQLLSKYHDTYENQVASLIRLNQQLSANKKAQSDNAKALKDGSATQAEYNERQLELVAQQRQLSQAKSELTQIMRAEEKAMMVSAGSYEQLSQQLSLLKRAYKELSEEGRTSPFGQELEAAIQNLDANLKDMAADIGEFQRNVGNYAIAGQNGVVATESLTAALNQEARTTQDLVDQSKILEEAKRMLNREDANYEATISQINAKLEENRRKLADVSDILGKDAKSVAEAEAQNKRLSEALKQVDLTSAGAKKKLEEIRAQIERNNKTINEATGANEKYADSLLKMVGVNANLGSSLQTLGQGGNFIDGLKIKTEAFAKTLMGLLSNPWVLTFLGIAGVGAAFKWWYEYNKGLIEASRLTENFTGLTGQAADKATADMQALADHMGKGYQETINAANVLVQQFGVSWKDAMELMQEGITAGADMSGNMLSNIERFAPALRDAGVTADEFMSILAETRSGLFNEQGIQLAVRGGTRLRAMTKQIAASLDAVGISSKQMQKDLSDGTMTMFQAVQKVAAKLKELPENSQEAGNIMKHVFGRVAAEGGTLLIQSIADVNTNLDEAKESMGELGEVNNQQMNAQRELNEALMAVFKMSGTSFEKMTIQAKTFITKGLTKIVEWCADIANWFIRIYNASASVRTGVQSIVVVFQTLWTAAKTLFELLMNGFKGVGGVLEGFALIQGGQIKDGLAKMKDSFANGFKGMKNIVVESGKELGTNFANAFANAVNGKINEISTKLSEEGLVDTEPQTTPSGEEVTPIADKNKKTADTYLQTLNKIEQSLSTINSKYNELAKKEGNTKALEHINELYKTQLAYVNQLGRQFGLSFKMPTSFKDIQDYRKAILDVINKLKGLGVKGADTAALELEMKIGLGNISEMQESVESNLKKLTEKISQTKTAKEFYDKILSETGDVELAIKISTSIYGTNGDDLYDDMVKYIQEVFKSGTDGVEIDLTPVFDPTNQRINWETLADIYSRYQGDLIKENRKTAKDIVDEGRKTSAENILTWQKELAKAKSFEEQRTDIVNRETQRRAAIIKGTSDPEQRNLYLSRSYEKQSQDLAKLAIDEFKSSDDYIKVFQDLDRVSDQTLNRVKKRLEDMIAQVKDTENVEGLKSLVAQLDKITQEKESRNPMQAVIDGFKEYARARKDYRLAEADEAKARAEYAQQEISLNKEIADAKAQQEQAQDRVNTLQNQGRLETSEGITAQLELNNATEKVVKATEKRAKAEKKVNDKAQKTTEALDDQKAALDKLANGITAMANGFDSAASSIQTIAEMMGIAEDSELGEIVNGLVSGLQNASTILTTILSISLAIQSACWWMLAIGGAVAAFTAIGSWLTGSKVRKANKEIEKQQKLLDQLQYTYNRLNAVADKLFGKDYIANFNQQKRNLEAQREAYLKQAEAEKKKGKKTDQEKVDGYLQSARDIADQIADMEGQLEEHFLGTDVASAAREFANAWLDAYLSFGNTADAIKDKFNDMIKNMIVESVLAQIVQRSLKPIFDEIDERAQDGELSANDIVEVMSKVPRLIDQIDNGLTAGMKSLESLGLDISSMRDETNEYKGIAKNVAGATSEEINALTAGINTQNYYMSGIPGIASHVAEIANLMRSGGAQLPTETTPSVDFAAYHANSLAQFQSLNNHAAQILTECQRSAKAAEETAREARNIAESLNRVIVYEGSSFGVRTRLKN